MKYIWERHDVVAGAKAKSGEVQCVLVQFSHIGEPATSFALINISTHQAYTDKDFIISQDDMADYLNEKEYEPDGRVISFTASN